MLPPSATHAALEGERPSIAAWVRRRGWCLRTEFDTPRMRAASYHPVTGRLIELLADLDAYPALPPAWRFVVPGTDDSPKTAWPAPGALAGVSGSIFHSQPCICAPWNRLAYSGGPHPEWDATSWTSNTGYTKADHIADMLDQIDLHLAASPGFQE